MKAWTPAASARLGIEPSSLGGSTLDIGWLLIGVLCDAAARFGLGVPRTGCRLGGAERAEPGGTGGGGWCHGETPGMPPGRGGAIDGGGGGIGGIGGINGQCADC